MSEEETVEPAEMDKYLTEDVHTPEQHLAFQKVWYESIAKEYDSLKLQYDESIDAKLKESTEKLREMLTENYKARKSVVRKLRTAGEKIDDKFVVV